jgi:hypothetical protein
MLFIQHSSFLGALVKAACMKNLKSNFLVRLFSSSGKDFYTPEDIKTGLITLADIHSAREEILAIKSPDSTKAERKQLKMNVLIRLSNEKFKEFTFSSDEDVQFYIRTSSTYAKFLSDFNVLFATAMRMPYKYFDSNISFNVWVSVLEGREKVSSMNARHNAEITRLADERKTLMEQQREEKSSLLDSAQMEIRIDNLTVDSLPASTLEKLKAIRDSEAQSKAIREALVDFKSQQLIAFSKQGSAYQLPGPK